jgi:hypothetical protein
MCSLNYATREHDSLLLSYMFHSAFARSIVERGVG